MQNFIIKILNILIILEIQNIIIKNMSSMFSSIVQSSALSKSESKKKTKTNYLFENPKVGYGTPSTFEAHFVKVEVHGTQPIFTYLP